MAKNRRQGKSSREIQNSEPEVPTKPKKRGFYERIGNWLDTKKWGVPIVAHVRKYSALYKIVDALVFAFVLAFLIIRPFIVEIYRIPSGSMEPTLQEPKAAYVDRLGHRHDGRPGDRVLVLKFLYRLPWFEPGRGDVVVFDVPKTIPGYDPKKAVYIKRIVGLPGETVEIRNERLFVDGKEVIEPVFFNGKRYINTLGGFGTSARYFESIRVPEGEVLVFGDNTENSFDGRYWGPIPIKNIRGRAVRIIWPLNRLGAPIP